MLEHQAEKLELTCRLKGDAHGGAENGIGGKRNWGATVDDQRRGLVLWPRNNLAEQARASIYRGFERRLQIWKGNAGGRREEEVTSVSYHGGH
jgi:transcription elongation factor